MWMNIAVGFIVAELLRGAIKIQIENQKISIPAQS